MTKHHKRLLVGIVSGIALGTAVSAVAIGSSAINGRTSNAGFEDLESVLVTMNPLEKSC